MNYCSNCGKENDKTTILCSCDTLLNKLARTHDFKYLTTIPLTDMVGFLDSKEALYKINGKTYGIYLKEYKWETFKRDGKCLTCDLPISQIVAITSNDLFAKLIFCSDDYTMFTMALKVPRILGGIPELSNTGTYCSKCHRTNSYYKIIDEYKLRRDRKKNCAQCGKEHLVDVLVCSCRNIMHNFIDGSSTWRYCDEFTFLEIYNWLNFKTPIPVVNGTQYKLHRKGNWRVFARDKCCVKCGLEIARIVILKIGHRRKHSLFFCSDDYRMFTIDHLLARSCGGNNDYDNKQAMCWRCNNEKSYEERRASGKLKSEAISKLWKP